MERGIRTGNDRQSSRHRYIHVTNVMSTNCHLHKNTTCHGCTKNMRWRVHAVRDYWGGV